MSKRMTWKEIHDTYPDMWVVLEDVIFLNNDRTNVESAIVVESLSDDDYLDRRLEYELAGKKYHYTRTEDTDSFCRVML